ncbi:MAG: cyclic nucleotide-binding domain-containing protein [Gammaproteobacteria bacterium]|nr:cyclic nucleotide-binding domain-containing protein [Gammaproteobacteria bacterium]
MNLDELIAEIISNPDFPEGVNWRRDHVPTGTEIIRQGTESRSLYWLEKGAVRVVGRVELEGQRQLNPGVCDLNAGEIFGELVLFDDEPRSTSVMAISDADLVVIDGDRLMEFLEQYPQLGFRFIKALTARMVSRLRKTNDKIFSLFAWGIKAHNMDQHL